MCGGGVPEDNSDEVARIETAAAERRRAEEAAERQRQEQLFSERLSSAYDGAVGSASQYFTQMGLDPADFMSLITQEATAKRSAVPLLDSNPGTYFAGLGQSVFDNAQTAQRNRALRDIDSFAGAGFDRSMIADTADDPIVQALLEEAYGDASTKIDAQRRRGILTDGGFAQAMKEIDKQKTRAKLDLDTVGNSLLTEGRGRLQTRASEGRTAANNLRLGSAFDPYSVQRDLSSTATDFLTSLDDRFRAEAPSGLFDLLKAQTVGGIGQGAQNTPYDQNASQGIFDLFAEEENKKKKKKDETVFESSF